MLSRSQLRGAIDGGSSDAYDRSIDMLVARLRRKIEPDPAKTRFIVTVPGVGYKFDRAFATASRRRSPAPSTASGSGSYRACRAARRTPATDASVVPDTVGFAALADQTGP